MSLQLITAAQPNEITMKIIILRRFTDPEVLSQVGKELLAKLFQHFAWHLARREFYLSVLMNSNSALYFQRVAGILRAQDYLPESFCQALVAIEQMAAPENESRLQAAVAQFLPEAALKPAACREALALQLWLSGKTSLDCGQDDSLAPNPNLKSATPHPSPLLDRGGEGGEPTCDRAGIQGTDSQHGTEPQVYQLSNHQPSTTPFDIPTNSVSASDGAGEPSTPEPPSSPPDPSPSNNPLPNNPPPANPSSSIPLPADPSSATTRPAPRKRRGKVAQLPKTVRDVINQMILDGFTYRQIIEALGEAGKDLSENALSTWRKGGYQDWLEERQRLDVMVRQHEFNIDLARNSDGGESHQAAFEIAALRVCDLLAGFDPAIVRGNLESDPADYATLINSFARLLNSLPRLSEGNLNCRREAAARKEQSNEKRPGLSTPTRRKIEKDLNLL